MAANVDFVVVDSTNFQSASVGGDVLQLRPIEVLFEEWAKLRAANIPTPKIAVWQNLQDVSGDLWQMYIDAIYKNPNYADLVFTDDHTQKQVFFATASPAPTLVTAIEQQGLAVVVMWALRNDFAKGE